jgi:serine/threonine-protein kinase
MTTVFNRLGAYEIIREIGRGGMAQVFLATDTGTGRQVALKLVPRGTDREARDVLDAEQAGAELQRQFGLVSTHVPAVYEHQEEHPGYFLVAMEYLDGENLSEVITRGALAPERAAAIAVELCRFLESAHRFEAEVGGRKLRSLVHGDLKPRNVRITSAGAIKVLDFGIAKALSLSRKVTRNDFGTMPYLSPERLDSGEVNEFADLWGVGVMLYEMVAGAPPFQAADTRRLEQLILARRPPPPLQGQCPVPLEAVVTKLLAPHQADRYASAVAVREDLERFLSGQQTAAEREGWPGGAVPLAVSDEATRRTRPAVADEAATRRTRPPALPVPAAVVPPPLPVASAPAPARVAAPVAAPVAPSPRASGRWRYFLRTGLLLFALGLVLNEFGVARAASRAAGAVATVGLDDLDDRWAEYEQLARRSYLNFGTAALEESLVDRTSELADRVIATYKSRLAIVYEAEWERARDALARALAVGGDDERLRAALRYAEGHLHRINGEARLRRGETAAGERELTEAVAAFREAAELRPGWPDPFLGLARTFIYGIEDVDRAADALAEAQRLGFTSTDRETAQLADGYRARGNALVRSARELSGMAQEADYLTRAAEAYRQALALYTQAITFADAPSNIRLTQRALDQVQRRLDALAAPPVDSILPWAPRAPQPGAAPPADLESRWRSMTGWPLPWH